MWFGCGMGDGLQKKTQKKHTSNTKKKLILFFSCLQFCFIRKNAQCCCCWNSQKSKMVADDTSRLIKCFKPRLCSVFPCIVVVLLTQQKTTHQHFTQNEWMKNALRTDCCCCNQHLEWWWCHLRIVCSLLAVKQQQQLPPQTHIHLLEQVIVLCVLVTNNTRNTRQIY